MKKITDFCDTLADKLASFGVDRWLHFVAGLVIGFLGALIFALTTKNGVPVTYAFCGVCAAVFVGLGKEIVDFFRGGHFDPTDWLFTAIGGVVGAALWMIAL